MNDLKDDKNNVPENTDITTFRAHNAYKGAASELFLKAVDESDLDKIKLLIKQDMVTIVDTVTIDKWKEEYQLTMKTFTQNEKGYQETIRALKAHLAAVVQPLVVLRPALLGIVGHFNNHEDNPDKEGKEWGLVRKALKGVVWVSKKIGEVQEKKARAKAKAEAKEKGVPYVEPEKKAVTKEMKKREEHNTDMAISGIVAFAKFCLKNAKNLWEQLKQVKLKAAYESIQAIGVLSEDDVAVFEAFTKAKLSQFETEEEKTDQPSGSDPPMIETNDQPQKKPDSPKTPNTPKANKLN